MDEFIPILSDALAQVFQLIASGEISFVNDNRGHYYRVSADEITKEEFELEKKEMTENSEKLNELLVKFKDAFGYELVEADKDCDYWKFERTAEGYNHMLILEDHRWELTRDDFDVDTDVGDWLIFSMLTNCERDWFGRFVETQYPLTYTEYKMIEAIIHELEKIDE